MNMRVNMRVMRVTCPITMAAAAFMAGLSYEQGMYLASSVNAFVAGVCAVMTWVYWKIFPGLDESTDTCKTLVDNCKPLIDANQAMLIAMVTMIGGKITVTSQVSRFDAAAALASLPKAVMDEIFNDGREWALLGRPRDCPWPYGRIDKVNTWYRGFDQGKEEEGLVK